MPGSQVPSVTCAGHAHSNSGACAGPSSGFGGRLKLLVVGGEAVGKTALTVRYLTKRFIGEYIPKIDNHYVKMLSIGDWRGVVEVWDKAFNKLEISKLSLYTDLDIVLVVYSIDNWQSYMLANNILEFLSENYAIPRTIIIANKSDLKHLRQVTYEDGRELGCLYSSRFHEVSVSENPNELYRIINSAILECLPLPPDPTPATQEKGRKSSSMWGVVSSLINRSLSVGERSSVPPDLERRRISFKKVFKKRSV